MAEPLYGETWYSVGLGTDQKAYYGTRVIRDVDRMAFGDMSPTFTGSDIKVLIIRKEDERMVKRAIEYLAAVDQAVTSNVPSDPLQATANLLRPVTMPEEFSAPKTVEDQYIYPVVTFTSLTISTFRNKRQVRALGHVNPRGIARGNRTVGGTIICTEFDRDAFWSLISGPDNPVPADDLNIGDGGNPVLPDQLNPFNIMMLFANEAGRMAYRMLYEVELVTNGSVYSVLDMYSENTLSFLAGDCTPLIPLPAMSAPYDKYSGMLTQAAVTVNTLALANSGKELVRRFRFMKNSRQIER